MNKLSFEHFMQVKEMAIATFGKNKGKHINDIDRGYARWMLDQMQSGNPTSFRFLADDGSGTLSMKQVEDALKLKLNNQKVAPTSVNEPIKAITTTSLKAAPKVTAPEQKKATEEPRPQEPTLLKPKESPEEEEPKSETNPHILDKEKLSEEQKNIDTEFEKMINGSGNHIMINALAGTGKTTILKHLAWKYGTPGQKWLYLVFNTKNRAEAKESSQGWKKFPDWVEVYTTNSFLGHVISKPENRGIIPATERMSNLDKRGGQKSKKLEKSRAMADSRSFQAIMTDVYKIPSWEQVQRNIPSILEDLGVPEERSGPRQKDTFYEVCEKVLKNTILSIRYNFQERSLTLMGLLKSFGVDPRDEENFRKESLKVFEKYDSHSDETGGKTEGYFDTSLEDVKERISKYKPNFQNIIISALNNILGYDFMNKNYREEVIQGAEWLLIKSLPNSTDEKYEHGNQTVSLGDYRDFSDDIWFPTIYADKIKWPKYDVILADEVQDFNEGQKIMIKKLMESGAKVVAVGDPNQAIYRFRGADNDAFNNLADTLQQASKDKEKWKPHSLSLNFRSRPEVLDYVNSATHVKDLKSGKKFKETDPNPEVTTDEEYEVSFDKIQSERSKGEFIETAYISRTNQPLVNAALKLLARGIPFAIVGKDVSGDITKHIKKIVEVQKFRDSDSVKNLEMALREHEEKEVDRNRAYSTKKEYLSGLRDTTEALINCIEMFMSTESSQGTIGAFKLWLDARLGGNTFDWEQGDESKSEADLKAYKEKLKKEKPVILTTAHKSKGLEFARVNILRDDQFPHPRAKHPEELNQESNTRYVAYTRAMHKLNILDPKTQPGGPSKKESY